MGTCIVFLLIFTCKLFKIHIVFSLGFIFDIHALCRICFLIVRKYFPELQWIDVLMGADNLSSHCSEANLRESRERFDLVKMVWSFTPGGCTDVVASPDNSLVQLEKLNIRRYYRDAVRANPGKSHGNLRGKVVTQKQTDGGYIAAGYPRRGKSC